MDKVISNELLIEWDNVTTMLKRSKVDLSKIILVPDDIVEYMHNEQVKMCRRCRKK